MRVAIDEARSQRSPVQIDNNCFYTSKVTDTIESTNSENFAVFHSKGFRKRLLVVGRYDRATSINRVGDYLYFPLGGNRGGSLLTYRNLLITMVLGGLWHGAAMTFVAWGLLQGAGLAGERFLSNLRC